MSAFVKRNSSQMRYIVALA